MLSEKLKTIWKKTPNNLEKLHPDFSEEGKKERQQHRWVCGCFCQNHSRYFKNFKNLFQF